MCGQPALTLSARRATLSPPPPHRHSALYSRIVLDASHIAIPFICGRCLTVARFQLLPQHLISLHSLCYFHCMCCSTKFSTSNVYLYLKKKITGVPTGQCIVYPHNKFSLNAFLVNHGSSVDCGLSNCNSCHCEIEQVFSGIFLKRIC